MEEIEEDQKLLFKRKRQLDPDLSAKDDNES